MACRILDILASTAVDSPLLVVDIFHISATRHPMFDMPTLVRRHDEIEIQIIPAVVRFAHETLALRPSDNSGRMHCLFSMLSMIASMRSVLLQVSALRSKNANTQE